MRPGTSGLVCVPSDPEPCCAGDENGPAYMPIEDPCGLNSLTRAIDGDSNDTFLDKLSARASMAPLPKDNLNSGAEAADARRREAGEKSGTKPDGRICGLKSESFTIEGDSKDILSRPPPAPPGLNSEAAASIMERSVKFERAETYAHVPLETRSKKEVVVAETNAAARREVALGGGLQLLVDGFLRQGRGFQKLPHHQLSLGSGCVEAALLGKFGVGSLVSARKKAFFEF